MNALSMPQPWAWLVTTPRPNSPKLPIRPVDNRPWPRPGGFILPQRIYIHAAKKMHRDLDCDFVIRAMEESGVNPALFLDRWDRRDFPTGGLVGEVTITAWSIFSSDHNVWYQAGSYGVCMTDPSPYRTLIPCKGRQGLFMPKI